MVTAPTAAARGSGLVLAAIILGIGVVGSQGMVVSPILPDVARALAASEGVVGRR